MNTPLKFFYFLLFGFILTAPILVYGFSLFDISLRLSRLFLIPLIPLFVILIYQKPSLLTRDSFYTFCFVPFLLYSILSIAWSPTSLNLTSRLGGLLEIFLIYSMMLVADLNLERFTKFIKTYLLSSIIPLVFAVWQLANNIFHFSLASLPFQSFLIPDKYTNLSSLAFGTEGHFFRISSTFAEPTIFGSYLSSVFLLGLLLTSHSRLERACLLTLRIFLLLFIFLSLSKAAILSLLLGMLVIFLFNKNFKHIKIYFYVLIFCFILIIFVFHFYAIFMRLLSGTGHGDLLLEAFGRFSFPIFIFGAGFNSIENGSLHSLIVSRAYEAGLFGLFISLYMLLLPFITFAMKTKTILMYNVKTVNFAVLLSIMLGLYVYDFFIHLFPWICIGAMMSFYNHYRIQNVHP